MKIFFILFIKFYKNFLSPLLGPNCRFYPSCSSYSLTCFETLPIYRAIWYSGKRICKCHPFHPGGTDFPPMK